MSRSLLKLVLVLLLVGILPFAASLVILDDLFTKAVQLGFNEEVQGHLTASADAHRQFFEAEKLAHALAADAVVADPSWDRMGSDPSPDAVLRLLREQAHLHPRLVSFSARSPRWDEPVVHFTGAASSPATPTADIDDPFNTVPSERVERRTIDVIEPSLRLVMTFRVPQRYIEELEAIGATLTTFRALETHESQLTSALRRTYLYFGGGAAVLALLLGTLLARRTTQRIGRIAEAANRVAGGNLSVRVDDQTQDELGFLARQFNEMVAELQVQHERVAYLQRVSAWQGIARRLAHEIKNPLTPILLTMQQLDRKFDELVSEPEQFRPMLSEGLEIVEEEVGTLRELVREFSEFARLPKVQPRPHDLAAFLEDFVRTNPQLTARCKITLTIDPGSRDREVAIDPIMMRRALVNLCDNALDAIEGADAAAPPTIDLAITTDGRDGVGGAPTERLWLRITDNGPGVADDERVRLFEPYFTTKSHGTGLGLPIVKKIVLDHRGWIELQNLPEANGCCVTISLPLHEGSGP